MDMYTKVIRIEMTAIYLVAALLLLSVGGLAGNAVAVSAQADPYPELYAPQPSSSFVAPGQKTAYFTFDDGPSENTERILDVLAKQGVKATFFVTGQNFGEPYAEPLLRRIVDEGHSLGLHSYSHRFEQIYASPDAYLADIDKLNTYLHETVGVRPGILRFPGGSATVNASPETMKALITELTRRGYLYYDWDVVSGDDTAEVLDAGYLSDRMVEGTQGLERSVILLHDSPLPTTSAQAVDLAIDRLRAEGYAFDRLTEQVEPVHIVTKRFQL